MLPGAPLASTTAPPTRSRRSTFARTSRRRRLAQTEHDIEDLLDSHVLGKLITSIDGIGPQTAARIIAAAGDPAPFKSAGAFAAYVGVVPGLRHSGKQTSVRAGIGPLGNGRLAARCGCRCSSPSDATPGCAPSTCACATPESHQKLALIAAMRKLLPALYSVARHRRPFVATEQGRAVEPPNSGTARPCAVQKKRLL
jgi:hypothetical protein